MAYIKENVNPMKRRTGDCSTRAVVKATGLSYADALREQCNAAIETSYGITDTEVVGSVLEKHGFRHISLGRVNEGEKRPTVKSISKLTKQKNVKAIVCRVASHFVACADGNYYDIWDSGNRSVYRYWIKETD